MPKSEQDLNLSSLEKLKANKLESPFEWKMDSKTPERPFRDRFKLGHNKIAGKITLQTEANDIVAMTSYLNKQNQYIMQWKTFYPMKKLMMDRSKSTSNINPNPIPTYTGQNISKYSSQQSKLDLWSNQNLNGFLYNIRNKLIIFHRRVTKEDRVCDSKTKLIDN